MPVENFNKVRTPAGSDGYALAEDLRLMALSMGVIIPVANQAERDAVLAAAASVITVSGAAPVMVRREDTGNIEVNNGTGWVPFRPDTDSGWLAPAEYGGGYSAASPAVQSRRIGNEVTVRGLVRLTSGDPMVPGVGGTTGIVLRLDPSHAPSQTVRKGVVGWVNGGTVVYPTDSVAVSTSANLTLTIGGNRTGVYIDFNYLVD